MPRNSAPSLRQVYEQWLEDQIEEYKEAVPRDDLLRLAEEVCEELRINQRGQYQLTEMLLCAAVDRKIVRLLKLPGYRAWAAARRASAGSFHPLEARPAQAEQANDARTPAPVMYAR